MSRHSPCYAYAQGQGVAEKYRLLIGTRLETWEISVAWSAQGKGPNGVDRACWLEHEWKGLSGRIALLFRVFLGMQS